MTGFRADIGPRARASGTARALAERESQRIIRQWDREIDDELRRAGARNRDGGVWRALPWLALWMIWLLVLVFLVAHSRALR